jgi:hypothetical protein
MLSLPETGRKKKRFNCAKSAACAARNGNARCKKRSKEQGNLRCGWQGYGLGGKVGLPRNAAYIQPAFFNTEKDEMSNHQTMKGIGILFDRPRFSGVLRSGFFVFLEQMFCDTLW